MNVVQSIVLTLSLVTTSVFCPAQEMIVFQNGTADFSQGDDDLLGPYSPDEAVNGLFDPPIPGDGWAIAEDNLVDVVARTAVWETTEDISAAVLRIELHMINFIGHFRFSVTTDDRSDFADGEDIDGELGRNWMELENPIASGANGIEFNLDDADPNAILIDANSQFPSWGSTNGLL